MEYWIWLAEALGAGSTKVNDVIAYYKTAENFYNEQENDFRSAPFLTRAEIKKLKNTPLENARKIMEETLRRGYKILTPQMPQFPNRLRNIYGVPAVLYIQGDMGDIDENVAVAMVGTRKCSDYGLAAAKKLSHELAASGAIVISGLARGIDTAAHKAALAAGGVTFAVLGCGLDVMYPKENAKLYEAIARSGAVISEYPLGARPEGYHFPVRNRLMSALSVGVVVVEADLTSGSLITANHALEQGKDVFAVPNSIFTDLAKGAFHLLKMGAIPVSCGADILDEYRYRYGAKITKKPAAGQSYRPSTEEKQPQAMAKPQENLLVKTKRPLPDDAQKELAEIYEIITEIPVSVDEIIARTQKNPAEVLTALSELEIMGFVSAAAGKRYFIV